MIPARARYARCLTIGTAFLVLLMGAYLATPLYPVYKERFQFSSLTLTLVFATYAVVLVPSLHRLWAISDRFGRRRVTAAGLAVAAIAMLVFALAQSTAWLFAARGLQGLAVGAISGTATAALVEVTPGQDNGTAALAAALAQAGGSSLGPIVAGICAEWLPFPRVLCYLVGLAAALGAAAAVLALPEPGRVAGRWHLQIPSIPPEEKSTFLRAGVTAAARSGRSQRSSLRSGRPTPNRCSRPYNLALLGLTPAVMLAVSCVRAGGRASSQPAPALIEPIGLGLLGLGLATLVVAFPAHSLVLLLLGAALAGSGHGLGFLGSQTEIDALAPDDRRGEVTAAFVTMVYAGVATAAIGVGVLSTRLSLFASFTVFAVVTGALSLATAVWHVAARRRPRTRRAASSYRSGTTASAAG